MILSWLAIGTITFEVAFLINSIPIDDRQWFNSLHRPRWLTFEFAIPFIWIFIFVCGILSASLIWNASLSTHQRWLLMGIYFLLEVAILAHRLIMCKIHSLMGSTIIGGVGFIIGLILAVIVFTINKVAFFFLLPYLLWSPFGTYVTWQMMRLNPSNA